VVASLLRLVDEKMNFVACTPRGFSMLVDRISDELGEKLSLSTVKRTWGYVPSAGYPSFHTLNILSRFVGFPDWHAFVTCQEDQSLLFTEPCVMASELEVGDELKISQAIGQQFRLRCVAPGRFTVLEAGDCCLMQGDTFECLFFAVGLPLYACSLMRDGRKLPLYIVARRSGLLTVEVISGK